MCSLDFDIFERFTQIRFEHAWDVDLESTTWLQASSCTKTDATVENRKKTDQTTPHSEAYLKLIRSPVVYSLLRLLSKGKARVLLYACWSGSVSSFEPKQLCREKDGGIGLFDFHTPWEFECLWSDLVLDCLHLIRVTLIVCPKPIRK